MQTNEHAIMMRRKIRHRRHANPFTLRGPIATPKWETVYGRPAPMALDIGFGLGGFVLELAARHPLWNVLGVEIRRHLVDGVNAKAKELGLANLHAVLANANEHLTDLLPDGSVVFASINFPDPWYKKRHHKRRVVNLEWLDVLVRKLAPEAQIHAMSDYEPIAVEMQQVLQSHPALTNLDGRDRFAASSTTGIATEREIKHANRGEPIYRMRFVRRKIWAAEGNGAT